MPETPASISVAGITRGLSDNLFQRGQGAALWHSFQQRRVAASATEKLFGRTLEDASGAQPLSGASSAMRDLLSIRSRHYEDYKAASRGGAGLQHSGKQFKVLALESAKRARSPGERGFWNGTALPRSVPFLLKQ